MQTLADFIDLERYPLDRLDSPAGCALVEDCRQMMSEGAICALEGFLRPTVVRKLADEVSKLALYILSNTSSGWPRKHFELSFTVNFSPQDLVQHLAGFFERQRGFW